MNQKVISLLPKISHFCCRTELNSGNFSERKCLFSRVTTIDSKFGSKSSAALRVIYFSIKERGCTNVLYVSRSRMLICEKQLIGPQIEIPHHKTDIPCSIQPTCWQSPTTFENQMCPAKISSFQDCPDMQRAPMAYSHCHFSRIHRHRLRKN